VKKSCAILQFFLILPENKDEWALLNCSAVTPVPDLKFSRNYAVKFLVSRNSIFVFISMIIVTGIYPGAQSGKLHFL
jgi:hypothetical protein